MNPIATQQAVLDNSLVPSEKRLKIEICNARIAFSKPQRKETYQVTLEARKLSPCYPAFVITVEVPQIYMHQFWNTIIKIRDIDAYSFKLDKNKCQVDTEVFRDILQICLRILNQDFIAPPSEEDLVTFIQELGYSGRYFMYQANNRDIILIRKENMSYLRFTKVIINHFISKDKTISMRNKINLHTIRDDSLLDIKNSSAYKTYYDFATGKVPPRKARKYKKVVSPPKKLSPVKEAEPIKKAKRVKRPAKKSTTAPTAGVVLKDTLGVSVLKKKAPAKGDRSKGIDILSYIALSEAAQLKEATKRSKKDFHISQASGSGDGTDFESGVPDKQQRQTSDTDEGTGDSEDDNDDEGDNNDDDDDASKGNDDKANNDDDGSKARDSKRTNSDDDDENPSFNLKDYDEEEHDEEYESDDDNENVFEEEDDDNMYKDVDPYEQVVEHAHVTLTTSQKKSKALLFL
ncbi:hypothetical protein Tco_1182127 [Tanacetum coccineum]